MLLVPGTRDTLLLTQITPPSLRRVLLLDLKLLPLTFEQLGDELPIGFPVILVSELEKGELADFLLGVTQHVQIGGVGGKKTAAHVRESHTNGGILEYRPPPLLAFEQRVLGLLPVINVRQQDIPANNEAFGVAKREAT